jgi:hypothetical protein
MDKALLIKTARRLQRCKDVLLGMVCDPKVN